MTDHPTEIPKEELRVLLEAYPREGRYALPAMQDMQRQYNYIPRAGLEALAQHTGRSIAQLYAMATFYKALSLRPKGRHIIKVCDGTACHIRGSVNLINDLERLLGVKPGETTADGEFSLELVNCLGSCALAPVIVVDEQCHGQVTAVKLRAILDSLRDAKEAGA
jgi:NADH-quinone oxidoreductase subunit E